MYLLFVIEVVTKSIIDVLSIDIDDYFLFDYAMIALKEQMYFLFLCKFV
jgi:hypothetical protein